MSWRHAPGGLHERIILHSIRCTSRDRPMRTTLDIDDPIVRELKRLREKEGKSLGRLASDLLARALKEVPTSTPGFSSVLEREADGCPRQPRRRGCGIAGPSTGEHGRHRTDVMSCFQGGPSRREQGRTVVNECSNPKSVHTTARSLQPYRKGPVGERVARRRRPGGYRRGRNPRGRRARAGRAGAFRNVVECLQANGIGPRRHRQVHGVPH